VYSAGIRTRVATILSSGRKEHIMRHQKVRDIITADPVTRHAPERDERPLTRGTHPPITARPLT
jgi:hypothetical protein